MCKDCKKPYYMTTAIAYTSGKPHIGNTYEIVLADSIARYKRARVFDSLIIEKMLAGPIKPVFFCQKICFIL